MAWIHINYLVTHHTAELTMTTRTSASLEDLRTLSDDEVLVSSSQSTHRALDPAAKSSTSCAVHDSTACRDNNTAAPISLEAGKADCPAGSMLDAHRADMTTQGAAAESILAVSRPERALVTRSLTHSFIHPFIYFIRSLI